MPSPIQPSSANKPYGYFKLDSNGDALFPNDLLGLSGLPANNFAQFGRDPDNDTPNLNVAAEVGAFVARLEFGVPSATGPLVEMFSSNATGSASFHCHGHIAHVDTYDFRVEASNLIHIESQVDSDIITPKFKLGTEGAAGALYLWSDSFAGYVHLYSEGGGLFFVEGASEQAVILEDQFTASLATKADLVGGLIPTSQIPALAISEFLGTVANQAAMLALVGDRGDWCVRTDTGTNFMLIADDSTLIGSWLEWEYPASPVLSVNGQTGVVVLAKGDIGLGNVDNTSDASKPVSTATQTALDAKQPLDSDLTAIAAIAPANDDIIQRKAGVWTNRTPAQVKTDLVLVKADVGLGNVDNTSDADKPVSTATQAALDAKQPLDSDLTTIAALSPSNDDFMQRKAGAWANRTIAQVKTDLGLPSTVIRKTVANESQVVNNSTTYVVDNALGSIPVALGESFLFKFVIFWNTAAVPDFKCRINASASPSDFFFHRGHTVPLGTLWTIANEESIAADINMTGANAGDGYAEIVGRIVNNVGGAITFGLEWAQVTANATDTKVLSGSYVELTPIT